MTVSLLSGVPAPSTRRALRARRRQRGRRRARQTAVAATALVAATVLGILTSGGTYALWSDEAPLDAGILRSGTTGLSVTGGISAAAFQNLLPGEVVAQQVTVVNTGGTDMALDAAIGATTTGFDVRVELAAASCGIAPLQAGGTTALGTTPTGLGSVDAGQSRSLCVEVTALAAALPSQSAPFVITLHGAQED